MARQTDESRAFSESCAYADAADEVADSCAVVEPLALLQPDGGPAEMEPGQAEGALVDRDGSPSALGEALASDIMEAHDESEGVMAQQGEGPAARALLSCAALTPSPSLLPRQQLGRRSSARWRYQVTTGRSTSDGRSRRVPPPLKQLVFREE